MNSKFIILFYLSCLFLVILLTILLTRKKENLEKPKQRPKFKKK